jgi:hypothetical protein
MYEGEILCPVCIDNNDKNKKFEGMINANMKINLSIERKNVLVSLS